MPHLSYRNRLLLSISPIFVCFALLITFIVYQREGKLKEEIVISRLKVYEQILSPQLDSLTRQQSPNYSFLTQALDEDIRLSIIAPTGRLLYDNQLSREQMNDDHSDRPEVLEAKKNSYGIDIRTSASNNRSYLYFACQQANRLFLRLSLPYDSELAQFLSLDNILIYLILSLLFITLLVFYLIIGYLVKPIHMLLSLTKEGEGEKLGDNQNFPNNEIGTIAKTILNHYQQIQASKEAVHLERERSIQIKQEMTGNIAHELRTPATCINAYLETLEEQGDKISNEARKSFIHKAYEQSVRLSELIKDVALLHKIENGTLPQNFKKIKLRPILENVFDDLKDKLKERQISPKIQLDQEVEILGSSSLMYSIFRNLTENAIAYAGTEIEIIISLRAQEDDKYYHISYADTGIGIPQEAFPRLFERFYRIDEGRTRLMGSSGLGLSIVKNAISLHQGTIKAGNRFGGGLELFITLPKL